MPDFYVTKIAGKEVAGLPNPGVGKTITLTDQQAEHPLRLKQISRSKEQKPKPKAPAEE